jgi:MFS family permease
MTVPQHRPPTSPGRAALVAAISAAVEWYDFFVYGTAAALIFPRLFFPASLPLFVSQIAAFSTFAVGFVARPLGGMAFGHFGDLHGRKPALVLAMAMMGLSTTLIGLLPGYAAIGAAAPLALMVLRFLQGLAVGGQWGAAALMAIESAPQDRKGFFGSFVQIGVPLGVVTANAACLAIGLGMGVERFAQVGWRLAFLPSVLLVGLSLWLGGHVDEVPAAPAVVGRSSPLLTVLRDHPAEILLSGGTFLANNTCFYLAITYSIAYGTAVAHVSQRVMLLAVMIGSLVMVPVLIAAGAVSDRHGRSGIFMVGAVLSGLWAFALFPLIHAGGALGITLAITLELAFISLMYGPQAALFAELFPGHVRYSGASLGYQLGSICGGGFAPIIATALVAHFHATRAVAWYVALTCALSFASALALRRRVRRAAALS